MLGAVNREGMKMTDDERVLYIAIALAVFFTFAISVLGSLD